MCSLATEVEDAHTIFVIGIRSPLNAFSEMGLNKCTVYLSNWNISLRLMPSRPPRFRLLDFSISDGPITLEAYIFGYDIIHNSSINSSSHFLSVSLTFLTLFLSTPSFLSVSLIFHLSQVCHVIASLFVSLPCSPFTFLTIHCCESDLIYRVVRVKRLVH